MDNMTDAFMKTEKGKFLVIQAKTEHKNIAERIRQLKQLAYSSFVKDVPRGYPKRIRQLKQLAYSSFVKDVPRGYPKRKDIYDAAKSEIRKIGKTGGKEYQKALTTLKLMWISAENSSPLSKTCSLTESFNNAVKTLIPD